MRRCVAKERKPVSFFLRGNASLIIFSFFSIEQTDTAVAFGGQRREKLLNSDDRIKRSFLLPPWMGGRRV